MSVKTIVLAGPPNAGKGTLLSELKRKGGKEELNVVSVSAMLRKEIELGHELGLKAKEYMDAGQLVPDEVINGMILERLKEANGIVVLDGYPRTKPQAEAMLEAGIIPVKAMEITLPDDVLIQRAEDRIICSKCSESYTISSPFKQPKKEGVCDICGGELVKRVDDDPVLVKARLEDYRAKTYPIFQVLEEAEIEVIYIDGSEDGAKERFFAEMDFS